MIKRADVPSPFRTLPGAPPLNLELERFSRLTPAKPAFPDSECPRGVSAPILLSQVRNTSPYLFAKAEGLEALRRQTSLPYLRLLRETQQRIDSGETLSLSHYEYFALCVSAHYASVGSFVPTDVDNQIRFRLWHPALPVEVIVQMAELVEECLQWDTAYVSHRYLISPSGKILSGHQGEWFSIAVAAYGALRRKAPPLARAMAERIVGEVEREAAIFSELVEAKDGVGLLKAATLIAHNLGDLDRVLEMWSIGEEDPLAAAVFKAGHDTTGAFSESLARAGALNKAFMAVENHRHFCLRDPRPLRRSPDFLIPVGPFFDEWGEIIARHPGLAAEEVGAVVDCLVHGWEWLRKNAKGKPPMGYSRALAGILRVYPGGYSEVARMMPAKSARILKAGALHQEVSLTKERFEEQWARMALKFIKG